MLAAFSGSASTAAALDQLDSSSLILSFPCLKRTPTAASQLLHSVKQLSDRWAQPGFQLQSRAHIYEGPPKSACCSRTYWHGGPAFIKPPRIVVLMAGDVSRSPAQLVITVKHLIDGSQFVDWLWVRTEPSVVLMQLSAATNFTADTSGVFWFCTAFHSVCHFCELTLPSTREVALKSHWWGTRKHGCSWEVPRNSWPLSQKVWWPPTHWSGYPGELLYLIGKWMDLLLCVLYCKCTVV